MTPQAPDPSPRRSAADDLSATERPAISRLVAAGARGAERVAHAAGVDHALGQAVEEAITRAIRSPAVVHAIERAIEGDASGRAWDGEEIAQLVRRALASDAGARAWEEVLESEQAQMLVERIAEAPEIRAAIASQGAGLLTDIGVRLTIVTERLDDALERVTRPRAPDSETDQAGLATRMVAAAIDLGLLFGAYSLVSGVLLSLRTAVFGHRLSLAAFAVVWALGIIVAGAIFAGFWTLAGQTPGMRFLSIRLTYRGAHEIPFGCAIRRVLYSILSLLALGLGYLAILRDPLRRAWSDRLAGTEVIYDTVARSAPYAGQAVTSAAAARHRPRRPERDESRVA